MKFERHWDDAADTYIITPIEENEFTDDGWYPGGAEWDECNPDEIPKWEDR